MTKCIYTMYVYLSLWMCIIGWTTATLQHSATMERCITSELILYLIYIQIRKIERWIWHDDFISLTDLAYFYGEKNGLLPLQSRHGGPQDWRCSVKDDQFWKKNKFVWLSTCLYCNVHMSSYQGLYKKWQRLLIIGFETISLSLEGALTTLPHIQYILWLSIQLIFLIPWHECLT